MTVISKATTGRRSNRPSANPKPLTDIISSNSTAAQINAISKEALSILFPVGRIVRKGTTAQSVMVLIRRAYWVNGWIRIQYIQALSRNTEINSENTVEIRNVSMEEIMIYGPDKIKNRPTKGRTA